MSNFVCVFEKQDLLIPSKCLTVLSQMPVTSPNAGSRLRHPNSVFYAASDRKFFFMELNCVQWFSEISEWRYQGCEG